MTKRPPPSRSRTKEDGPVWIYGRHAVLAVLNNPKRHQHKLLATKNALDWLAANGRSVPIAPVKPEVIDRELHQGAVHQGIAVKVNPLAEPDQDDLLDASTGRPVVVLDQVTDPQNIGALFRIAAAFGAGVIIAQDRRTPPLAGALAKAAVGTVETLPMLRVVNIARTLTALREAGYHTVGLAGEAASDLPSFKTDRPVALVLGAEGAGLRELVRETCESLVRIPMAPEVESLNVATAAGIALYGMTVGQPT